MAINSGTRSDSILGLVDELREEAATLIRQEVQLAKTEMAEKCACWGRNAASLAAGALVACAGLIVVLVGLGMLAAMGFEKLDMNPRLAQFLGLVIVGFVVLVTGYAFVSRGLHAFTEGSLAPEKTLHSLRELKGSHAGGTPIPIRHRPEPKVSSGEVEARIGATRHKMEETFWTLRRRLRPKAIARRAAARVKAHPVRVGLIGVGSGLAGFLLYKVARLTRRHQHV